MLRDCPLASVLSNELKSSGLISHVKCENQQEQEAQISTIMLPICEV